MAKLVIDRALHGSPSNPWPHWEEMLGIGEAERIYRARRGGAGGGGGARGEFRARRSYDAGAGLGA